MFWPTKNMMVPTCSYQKPGFSYKNQLKKKNKGTSNRFQTCFLSGQSRQPRFLGVAKLVAASLLCLLFATPKFSISEDVEGHLVFFSLFHPFV